MRVFASRLFLALVTLSAGLAQAQDSKKDSVGASTSPTSAKVKEVKKRASYRLPPPPANYSPPVISIEAAVHNWGSALQGEIVEHTFLIKNTGGAPLVIDRIKPSCGCTTVAKPEKPIAPGGSDEVTLRIDTKRLPEKARKTANIFSNDPASPFKLAMEGTVEKLFAIDPALPRMSTVRGTSPEPLKVKLTRAKSDKPVKVVEAKSSGPILTTTVTTIKEGESYEIDLVANVDGTRKFYQENVMIKVESGEDKTLEIPIPVSITVKERIHVEPRSSVYFNRKETQKLAVLGAAPLQKELLIKSLGGESHKFKITEVGNAGGAFETKLETIVEGQEYKLIVVLPKLPEDERQRRINEKLVLKTDDPTVPEITVTALAAVR